MKSHTLAAAVAVALNTTSPIFGQNNNLVDQGRIERTESKKRKAVKRSYQRSGHAPEIGAKQIAKALSGGGTKRPGQYPEYLALEARNIASGKWAHP